MEFELFETGAGSCADGRWLEAILEYQVTPASADCNGNLVPDECELASGAATDCNGNGVLDECDLVQAGQGFERAPGWAAFDPGEAGLGADLEGYTGAGFDGRYVYFVPSYNNLGFNGNLLRYDTRAPFNRLASWGAFNMASLWPEATTLATAAFDGRYLYMPTQGTNPAGTSSIVRYDTTLALEAPAAWDIISPKSAGFTPGPGLYNSVAWSAGYLYFEGVTEMLRYDPQGALDDPNAWIYFDRTSLSLPTNSDYFFPFSDGRYLYVAPVGWNRATKILRYDGTQAFDDPNSWEVFDPNAANVTHGPAGYRGGCFDGRYVYFSPSVRYPTGVTASGEVLRYDTLGSFSAAASWVAFDAAAAGVGDDPRGYYGALYDGRFIYFAPHQRNFGGTDVMSGEVLRLDTTRAFDELNAWQTFVPAAHGVGVNPEGYSGGVFDGRYLYFSPQVRDEGGTWVKRHGEVLRYDTWAGWSRDANANAVPDECETCRGDANCDDVISWRDIDFFVAGLNDNTAAWEALFAPAAPPCVFANLDVNADEHVTWRDIDPFIATLNQACP